jgi:hypothetical protein
MASKRRLASRWPLPTQLGAVYTLHFDRPIGTPGSRYGQAQHVTGWARTWRLETRWTEHRSGRCGMPLCLAFRAAGIDFIVAAVEYDVTRARENQLKLRSATGRCPVCRALRHGTVAIPPNRIFAGVILRRPTGEPGSRCTGRAWAYGLLPAELPF